MKPEWMTILCAVPALAAGILTLLADGKRLTALEKVPRLRLPGLLLGWIVLAVCVPHARAVSPDFLLPFLIPLAVIVPPLGAVFVDNATARAWAGALILGAYGVIHLSFECRLPLSGVLAVGSWAVGAVGICVSGYPTWFRDGLRLFARRPLLKWFAGIFFILYWVVAVIAAVAA